MSSQGSQSVDFFSNLAHELLDRSKSVKKDLSLPSKAEINRLIPILIHLLFPRYYYEKTETDATVHSVVTNRIALVFDILSVEILKALEYDADDKKDSFKAESEEKTRDFIKALPSIRDILDKDLDAVLNHDPAAKNKEEVVLAYPGFEALAVYRLSHYLYKHDVPFIPRIMSENVHSRTGIDIHPGATIGAYCSIDHGTGLIIGETTIIGEHVSLYHNVTLGARSVTPEFRGKKRHPTIGSNVIIYPGATVLGDIEVGDNSLIGGNVFLLNDCPANSKLYAIPPEVITKKTK
jgi:serine O-acetyltransferase